ncbi:MAG TPA: hypothetical protein VNS09_13775 [Solirubrobacter sp.]|nr:hypothetical protein [Solirubrobacter sp.]
MRVLWLLLLAAWCGGSGACGGDEPADVYHSVRWGYTVTVPDGWYRAADTLTPNLDDPREVLTVATFPLHYREGKCAQFPSSALSDMGTTDVLLTVQERGTDPRSRWHDFPPRPAEFRFQPGQGSEAVDCVSGPVRFVDHWFRFTDGGRHFHVEVALGTAAPEAARRAAYAILDSLRIDPNVTPDWTSSG